MPTLISTIETLSRQRLIEPTARFWSSAEIVEIINAGIRDLWRDIVDLKEEHFLTVNSTDVSMPASSSTLLGVPNDVHKIHLIEPRDTSSTSTTRNVTFDPLDYNHKWFRAARSRDAVDPPNETIFYAITGQGAPATTPVIYVAPQVNSQILLDFVYVPTLGPLTSASAVPIPGEADNALIAWTVAFARGKEREDRAPDPNWLAIYATEKEHLLQSLGLRQTQEQTFVEQVFAEYWL